MAYSYVAYTGNGVTTQFTVSFPYIRKEHVFCTVNAVNTSFTWVNSTTIQLASAPANGVQVVIKRITPVASRLVDYADGSTLVAADLDTDSLQHLYTEQELTDNVGPVADLRGVYYGAYLSDLALSPSGQPLEEGDLYFNKTTNQLRVYDGAAWKDASADATITRFLYTATAGQTSVTGADSNGNILVYNIGLELVHVNGALLTRGVDYTATNTSTITGFAPLSAGDLVEVLALSQIDVINSIPAANIADNTIPASKLADGALTAAKIADGAVTSVKIADSAVTSAKIADSAVTTAKIADSAITVNKIAAGAAVPIGAVFYFASNTAPTGYLKCNGDTVPNGSGTVQGVTTNFAALYAVLGSTYGTAGALPDLRGEFARGWDDGRGIDSGRTFGSSQAEAIQSHNHTGSTATAGSHTHTIDAVGNHQHITPLGLSGPGGSGFPSGSSGGSTTSGAAGAHSHTMQAAGDHSHTFTTNNTGGAETRPRNIALLACIKY